MSWFNADFAALMTSGETHLRKEVGFPQVTQTDLNLGDFDWTVEFWFYPLRKTDETGTVFEIGTGPRGENRIYTTLKLDRDMGQFIFYNQPSRTLIEIPSSLEPEAWQHLAFVYDSRENQLTYFVNGKMISQENSEALKPLPVGEEDYMSVGRNGLWKEPLQGKIDELRFSQGMIYPDKFTPPQSFSYLHDLEQTNNLIAGPELLFDGEKLDQPIKLGSRKHLFIDDALLETTGDAEFVVNPPRMEEIVLTNIKGHIRKHLSVVEDKDGNIRIYTTVEDDYLAVWISKDGVHFTAPDLPNGHYKGRTNIVLHKNVGMGIVFTGSPRA
ncbi:MAG: LamG domain-containing protein [candidate division KSB1 bacterium]|nr:LamG domain-containing protein [candidate division KSB1 bacterium]